MASTNTALFLTDLMLLYYAAYYVSVSAWARSGWSSVSFVPRGASSLRQNDCFRMLLHSSPDFSAFLSLVRAVCGSGASCFECFTFAIQQHRPQAVTDAPLPCRGVIVCIAAGDCFRANNRSSNLDCSSQASARMQRHKENQDGGPAEIKIVAFWRFLAVFARKTYGRQQIELSSD